MISREEAAVVERTRGTIGVGALGETLRLAGQAFALGARAALRRAGALSRGFRPIGRTPEKILIAPQDLRASDPTCAVEIYAGSFSFAGKTLETGGGSPFLAEAPSRDWAAALHGFGWLRHLRAADTTLARSNGRALVDEWIAHRGGPDPAARAPEVAARRLIAWLSHSPLILEGADRAFYRRFLKSIARQTKALGRGAAFAPEGAPRLLVEAALAYAGLCLAGEARLQRLASAALGEELDRQILVDGGHVSRNPADLVDLLLDLIPLRQAYAARNLQPPASLVTAIDRMTPMLRFFRHGDGDFAQFNGAGPTSTDEVATILAYDDARGRPVDDASHSGYQRLAGGSALVLMDAGAPPLFAWSEKAHAGCLSVEFSSGSERLVVNCGSPRFGRSDWERAARATAAHSTVTIGNESSCRFASDVWRRIVGGRIVSGPGPVSATRRRDLAGVTITASHDGYAARFGVVHERSVTLADDGLRLSGEDVFRSVVDVAIRQGAEVAARFHLHPAVKASALQDGQGVMLAAPSGSGWSFAAPGFAVTLEESVHLGSTLGPRRAGQIVVRAPLASDLKIAWSFDRLPAELSPRRKTPGAPKVDPLPL